MHKDWIRGLGKEKNPRHLPGVGWSEQVGRWCVLLSKAANAGNGVGLRGNQPLCSGRVSSMGLRGRSKKIREHLRGVWV